MAGKSEHESKAGAKAAGVDHARHKHEGHAHGPHDHAAPAASGHGPAAHADHPHDDHSHAGHSHAGHSHGGHSHAGHDHAHAMPRSLRAFAIGASVNFAFVVIEAIFGFLSGSLALLADAGHNLSDVLGLLLAWAAAWLSTRPPTARRTFGLGRSSILAALANAVILLLGTGGIIVEALSRFSDPQPIETGIVMAVALVGIGVNFGTALLFMADRKSDLNVRGAFVHLIADAAVSLGVVVAAGVIAVTGALWLDPVVSLGIAAAIILGTWGLFRDSVDMAMDAVPAGIERPKVEAYLAARPGVAEVHDLHIWALSTTETALTAHLVRPGAALDDAFLTETCAGLKTEFGIGHAALQVEAGDLPCPLAPSHVV
ncbi:cation diffusion facilitator family transporter [Aquabacter spiritensis]|uniref:Cobalt-zinc-cadmium efflux system protein n=1 Tax=Aquabacter spiritensis TaxID=933073 RepID=A0A4R3M4H7_9HYPH|nr:cation diffusion facilitator family transporter [Aquabacter spiritensis]TCT08211.1 cobalt-zinc-cadmium efflux system protein [Aquabacter spiritensis]